MSSVVDESIAPSSTEPPPPPAAPDAPEENPTSEGPAKEEAGALAVEVPQAEEVAKVKITRRAIRTTSAPPKDAEVVELPEDLDIFWLPVEDPVESASATTTSTEELPASADLPPPEILEEALNKLLITLHPQVQHRATYPTGPDPPVEPTLGLYCPIEGGDYVIDATVRELARRTGAEVLVLDSVQLAAGECGHFGKAANSLQLPVNPLHLPLEVPSPLHNRPENSGMEEDDEDGPAFPTPQMMTLTLLASPQTRSLITPNNGRRPASRSRIKVFFDTLINSTPKSNSDTPAPSSSPRPRIIYIRDFAMLAPTSSTWYPPLLSAVRQRRRGPISRLTSPVANPITIVFGMTPSLTPPVSAGAEPSSNLVSYLMSRNSFANITPQETLKPERVDWSESESAEKARERRLQDRLKKWERHELALFDEFPKLSTTSEDEGGEGARPEMVVLGSGGRGMAPIMGQPQPSRLGLSARVGGDAEKKTSFFRSSVLVPATRSHAKERETRVARRREVNELAMRMGVGAVGGTIEETAAKSHFHKEEIVDAEQEATQEASSKAPDMWEDWGNRIEVWPNVKKIADRAVGSVLASEALAPPEKTLDATVVPWDAIKAAWSSRKALKNQRRAWLKGAGTLTTHELEEATKDAVEPVTDEIVEKVRNDADLDPYEQRLLGCIVDSASMPTSFSQVHLPPHTIDSVRTIVSLPLLHPHAFQHGILKQHSMSGCLLFGPPGTGKTLVVRALAKDAGCRMLAITPSDIMDMYVGESEKLVRAVFSLARRLSPCVVFLDEIDALFGARMSARESGGASAAHRVVITEFMQEMDGLKSSKEDGVVVIGATNRPFDLDDAVLRRLPRRLLVDLPGEKEREGILKILLRDERLAPDVTPAILAAKTENFSGSDLKHLCVSAALDAVKEHFEVPWKDLPSETPLEPAPTTDSASSTLTPELSASTVESPVVASTEPEAPATCSDASTSTTGAPSETSEPAAKPRVLHLHNFTKALKEITPSSSESLGSLADLRKWNDEFGEGRRGKKRSPWGKGLFGFVDTSTKPSTTEGKVAAASTTSTTNSSSSSP